MFPVVLRRRCQPVRRAPLRVAVGIEDGEAADRLVMAFACVAKGPEHLLPAQSNIAKITVRGVPDQPGVAAHLFGPLAEAGVSVDTIVQNASVEQLTDMTFTVGRDELEGAVRVVEEVMPRINAADVIADPDFGSVSIVGTGMASTPGYAARMFQVLYEHSINIELISTSEIRITCIVRSARVESAVRALHDGFDLDRE